jgi:hypothetical protein
MPIPPFTAVIAGGRPFDGLIVATGAQRRRAVPRVMTFEGPAHVEAVHGLLQDVEAGFTRLDATEVRR